MQKTTPIKAFLLAVSSLIVLQSCTTPALASQKKATASNAVLTETPYPSIKLSEVTTIKELPFFMYYQKDGSYYALYLEKKPILTEKDSHYEFVAKRHLETFHSKKELLESATKEKKDIFINTLVVKIPKNTTNFYMLNFDLKTNTSTIKAKSFKQETIFAELTAQELFEKLATDIVHIMPALLLVLVSYIALRKAIAFIKRFMEGS